MLISRRKYLEMLISKQRIEKLEHIICPNGHDYKKIKIGSYYVCTKCGKVKKVNE
jgi:hypothetical protein